MEESDFSDLEQASFNLSARFAVLSQQTADTCGYIMGIFKEFQQNQELFERAKKGDWASASDLLQRIAKYERVFTALSNTVRELQEAGLK